MERRRLTLILLITLSSLAFSLLVAFAVACCRRRPRRRRKGATASRDVESSFASREADNKSASKEDFMKFTGGENLSIHEILEAPGEVIGKSSYGSLYKASLVKSDSVALLRFLRPSCSLRVQELVPIVEVLGSVRHANLVPLRAFYAGCRGEKLMVYPFYGFGNLAQFIRGGGPESRKWPVIHRISTGIAKGLLHLHASFEKPLIHGNLKSKNVLLDSYYNPHVSDFGLHLVFNSGSAQKVLEASAREGYKAPEVIKMRDVSRESDIYGLGVIFLEMITAIENPMKDDEEYCLPSLLRNGILEDRLVDLYRRDILDGLNGERRAVIEDCVLRFFQLGMACCSPSRLLRPDVRQVLEVLEEIGDK